MSFIVAITKKTTVVTYGIIWLHFYESLLKSLDSVVIWKFLCQCNIIEVCSLPLLTLPSQRGRVWWHAYIKSVQLECNYWSECYFLSKDGVWYRCSLKPYSLVSVASRCNSHFQVMALNLQTLNISLFFSNIYLIIYLVDVTVCSII